MSVAVLLSRVLGLVRELVLAAIFGAGMVMDAYLVAFRIPNLLRDLFAEGALSQAFVSVFASVESDEERKNLVRDTQRLLSAALFVVCLLVVFFSTSLVESMAEGFAPGSEKFSLTIGLTRLLAPFLYFVSFAALAMGILNSLGIFFIPALGSAAFNFVNVALGSLLAWYFWDSGMVAAMWGWSIGTLVAGFTQWSIQWPALRQKGFLPMTGVLAFLKPSLLCQALKDQRIKKILWIMAPAILGVAATQINVFVSTIYATSLAEGSVSWLSYAFRLMHFPMGVFGVALSTAALPQLAKLVSKREEFSNTLVYAMSLAVVLAVGSTAGLFALGHPIVSWIYERGAFGSTDTMQTTYAIYAYSTGLLAFVGLKIVAAAYYAFAAVWIPSLVSLLAIGINVLGMQLLSKHFAHAGLALSTSIVSTLNMIVLIAVLKIKYKVVVVRWAFVKTLLASIFAAALVFAPAYLYLNPFLLSQFQHGIWLRTTYVLTSVAATGTLYLLIVSLLRPEGRVLTAKIFSKIRKRFG